VIGRRPAAGLVAALTLLAGCRIGGSDRVEEVDSNLLSGLNEPTTSTTTTLPDTVPDTVSPTSTTMPPGATANSAPSAPSTTVATEPMRLYFVEGSQLVPIEVEVPEDLSERRRLALLEDGPPAIDASAGVRTALVPGLIAGMTIRDSREATIDLDGEVFAGVADTDQRLMIGQIVLTLVARPGIDRVGFTRDGEPLAVPLRNLALSEPGEAVDVGDYESLLVPTPSE
jgi:hypothetical protein